jgi:hypothetical protein
MDFIKGLISIPGELWSSISKKLSSSEENVNTAGANALKPEKHSAAAPSLKDRVTPTSYLTRAYSALIFI